MMNATPIQYGGKYGPLISVPFINLNIISYTLNAVTKEVLEGALHTFFQSMELLPSTFSLVQ